MSKPVPSLSKPELSATVAEINDLRSHVPPAAHASASSARAGANTNTASTNA
jgi:hypothetical protein